MKFICEVGDLQKALSIVTKAISARTNLPILEGIYIKAAEAKVELFCSSIEVSIFSSVDATVTTAGKTVVDGKKIFEFVQKLKEGAVEISEEEGSLIKISQQKAEIKLPALSAEEFPTRSPLTEKIAEVDNTAFKKQIERTIFCVSNDPIKGVLVGGLFEWQNSAQRIVTLDGYKMSVQNIEAQISKESSLIIPGQALREIQKIMADGERTEIFANDKAVMFRSEKVLLWSKLIEGNFMKYSDIIPKESKTKAKVSAEELLSAIDKAGVLLGNEDKRHVVIGIGGGALQLNVKTQFGESNEEIAAEISGDDLRLGMNDRFLKEVIKTLEGDCFLLCNGPTDQCLVKEEEASDNLFLIMPTRLEN